MRKMLVLLTILLISAFPCLCSAQEEVPIFTSGEFDYLINEDGTVTIYAWYGNSEILDLPSVIDGLQVSEIGEYSFSSKENLISVSIPEGIKTLEEAAFYNCPNLIDVSIPDSVTIIGDRVFSDCISLNSISLSDKVTTIGKDVFQRCTSLNSISISPDNEFYAVIDSVLFDKKEKALLCYPIGLDKNDYSVPEGISKIGTNAFSGCDLVTISLPETIQTIEDGAFSQCEHLEKVDLKNGLETIGEKVFAYCTNLSEIEVPETTNQIGKGPFLLCHSLKDIRVSQDNETFIVSEGVLYNKKEKSLIYCPDALSLSTFSVPEGISSIADFAFYYCESLTALEIPYSVSTIGESAFAGCGNLKTAKMPDSISSIGRDAFYNCSNLTLLVERDSYPAQYAQENGIPYTYPDANDWLNE